MQETSALYKSLLSDEHIVETRLVLGESGLLVDDEGDVLVFGTGGNATRILVEQGGAEDGFTESVIFNMKTYRKLFPGNTPSVGNAIASEIEVDMINPIGTIERMSQMIPYIRLSNIEGTLKSEWIKKGEYYIDTREISHNDDDLAVLTLHGYDALAKAQADYPSSSISYPALDTAIVGEIANALGVEVDDRTYPLMNKQYRYGLPVGYSMQEVLCYIAASYGGNFIITDLGKLRLVTLTELPPETRYLITETGYVIVIGGDRILV
jgi:hypothetical protein